MFNKLKNQLTLWYSLGILVAIVFLLVFFFFATNVVFYSQVDETLSQHLKAIAAAVESGAKKSGCGCLSPESSFLNGILQIHGMPTAIFDENGRIVKSSVDFVAPPNIPSSSISPFFNAPLSDQTYRFLNLPVISNNQQIGSVLMGHPIDAFLKTRSVLIIVIIIIIFIIFIPVVLLGRFLAQKALSKEKQFLTDLAHSLKTPLAVLQSQIENPKLIKFGQSDKSSLLSQIKKLSSLVNETLASNYLAGDQKNASTDLTALLEELSEITQALGMKKKITLSRDLPASSFWVKGSRQQLAKAFLSVLENAVSYGKQNGRIEVVLKKNRHQAILAISDDGTGIHKKDLPHVFARFYRGKNEKSDGHGLGLCIAKNIIEELGGRIKIESQKNKGTQVFISLPVSSTSFF